MTLQQKHNSFLRQRNAPVDEVRHGLDHAELNIVVNAAHQPKVQDAQPAVGRANQVARVRVRLLTGTALLSHMRLLQARRNCC